MGKNCRYIYNGDEYTFSQMRQIILDNPTRFNNELSEELAGLVDTTKQIEILNNLDNRINNVVKNSEGYIVNGEKYTRVTEIVNDKVYDKIFSQDSDDINNSRKSVLDRTKGTILHAYAELIMKEYASGKSISNLNFNDIRQEVIRLTQDDIRRELAIINEQDFANNEDFYRLERVQPRGNNDLYYNNLATGLRKIYDQITDREIVARRGNPEFRFEQIIYDETTKRAGTVDLLVVYGDGTTSIYDYKFVNLNFRFDKDKNAFVPEKSKEKVPQYKYDAYNVQIGEYRGILKNGYNSESFGELRIVRVGQSQNFIRQDDQGDLKGIKYLEFSDDRERPYLGQIPTTQEVTTFSKFNDLLATLREELNFHENKLANKPSDEISRVKVDELRKAIDSLLIDKDFTVLSNRIKHLLQDIETRVHIEDNENPYYMDFDELNDSIKLLQMYETISDRSSSFIRDLLIDTPEVAESTLADLDNLRRKVIDTKEIVFNEVVDRLQQLSRKDITEEQVDAGIIGYLKSMSDFNAPLIVLLRDLIQEATTKTKNNTEVLEDEIKELRDELEEWAKTNNKTIQEGYEMLVNTDTGNLISKLNPKFYDLYRAKAETKDIVWFKDNYQIREGWKERFDKRREQYITFINKTFPESEGKRDWYLERWDRDNDLETSPDAWLNYNNHRYSLELKDISQWTSDRFKQLQNPENETLLKLYNYHRDKIREFENLVDRDFKVGFIPNIKKSFVDKVMTNKKNLGGNFLDAVKDSWDDIKDDLQIHEGHDDELMGALEHRKIPVLYTRPLEGNVKSFDLLSNLLIFGHMAINHSHMEDIEGAAMAGRNYLATQSIIPTDSKGNPIIDKLTDELKKVTGTQGNNNLRLYESFMDDFIYGKTIQNKELFPIGNVSGNKLIKALMKYMSLKTLSFNWRSALPGAMAAYFNSYYGGVKEQFYSREQMFNAHKMLVKREDRDKFAKLREYFQVERENWSQEQANKLKANKASQIFTYENYYLLQRVPDEFVSDTILVAMLQNYGLDDNGMPKRLAYLPDNTPSLFDNVKLDNNEISIEGMNDASFTAFRRIVKKVSQRMKGTNSQEDPSAIQYHVMGKALMHFRNWIAPMVAERFGNLGYSDEVNEFEVGRYRVLVGELFHGERGLQGVAKKALKLFGDLTLGMTGINKITGRKTIAVNSDALWSQFLNDPDQANNEIRKKLKKGELSNQEAKKMYLELRNAQLRAVMAELRMVGLLLGAQLALLTDWDDDGI
jgi:hypothetical protein